MAQPGSQRSGDDTPKSRDSWARLVTLTVHQARHLRQEAHLFWDPQPFFLAQLGQRVSRSPRVPMPEHATAASWEHSVTFVVAADYAKRIENHSDTLAISIFDGNSVFWDDSRLGNCTIELSREVAEELPRYYKASMWRALDGVDDAGEVRITLAIQALDDDHGPGALMIPSPVPSPSSMPIRDDYGYDVAPELEEAFADHQVYSRVRLDPQCRQWAEFLATRSEFLYVPRVHGAYRMDDDVNHLIVRGIPSEVDVQKTQRASERAIYYADDIEVTIPETRVVRGVFSQHIQFRVLTRCGTETWDVYRGMDDFERVRDHCKDFGRVAELPSLGLLSAFFLPAAEEIESVRISLQSWTQAIIRHGHDRSALVAARRAAAGRGEREKVCHVVLQLLGHRDGQYWASKNLPHNLRVLVWKVTSGALREQTDQPLVYEQSCACLPRVVGLEPYRRSRSNSLNIPTVGSRPTSPPTSVLEAVVPPRPPAHVAPVPDAVPVAHAANASQTDARANGDNANVLEDADNTDGLGGLAEIGAAACRAIDMDLYRTASRIDPAERAAVRRLLTVLPLLCHGIVYCQALNYVALAMLRVSGGAEEDVFWLLRALCEDIVPGYYTADLRGVREDMAVIGRLVTQRLPELDGHLRAVEFPVQLYATQWLLSCFSSSFPRETFYRIWDCMFLWGRSALLFGVLAFLRCKSAELLMAESIVECGMVLKQGSRSFF